MKSSIKKALIGKLIAKGKEDFSERRKRGLLAPISPTPLDLIDLVVNDVTTTCSSPSSGPNSPQRLGKQHLFVVDLGAGDGRWLTAFSARGCICYGLELDSERIQATQRRLKHLSESKDGERYTPDDGPSHGCVEIIQADLLGSCFFLVAMDVIICYLGIKGSEEARIMLEGKARLVYYCHYHCYCYYYY